MVVLIYIDLYLYISNGSIDIYLRPSRIETALFISVASKPSEMPSTHKVLNKYLVNE